MWSGRAQNPAWGCAAILGPWWCHSTQSQKRWQLHCGSHWGMFLHQNTNITHLLLFDIIHNVTSLTEACARMNFLFWNENLEKFQESRREWELSLVAKFFIVITINNNCHLSTRCRKCTNYSSSYERKFSENIVFKKTPDSRIMSIFIIRRRRQVNGETDNVKISASGANHHDFDGSGSMHATAQTKSN
jgi:hypothetical protein